MKLKLFGAMAACFLMSACVTAEQEAAKAEAQQARLAAVKAESTGEKVSLDKSVEEHGEVTLLDDETGEEKMICKYIKTTGTRFGRKVCATPEEWEQLRLDSQEETAKVQRNMNAGCPAGGGGCN